MDSDLSLEFLRVVEQAAIACAHTMGNGDRHKSDQVAVEAMRAVLDTVPIDGTIVIGEGERDEAPMLYIGEKVGLVNAKGIKSLGMVRFSEIDIAVDPLEGTNLCATGGHTVKDNRVPFQPRNKVALTGLYTFNFTPGSLTLSASWLWRDTQYSSIFNRSELLIPSYDQTDLRMTWQSAENKYSVVGFVRNVFDDEGFESAGAAATASGITQTYSLTPPRQYGVEFQYRFDM